MLINLLMHHQDELLLRWYSHLVIPVKVVEVVPVYVICSVPIINVPVEGKPAVVSTVIDDPVAGLLADQLLR